MTAIDTNIDIDPNSTADEIFELIEAAEEAKELGKVVAFLRFVSRTDHAGEEDWSESAEAALDALYRSVKGGETSADDSFVYLKDVSAALHTFLEHSDAVVEVCLGCIVAIASKANRERETEGASGDDEDAAIISVEDILKSMQFHEDEPTIQEQGCLVIEGLAMWKTCWKEELLAAEGLRKQLIAARDGRITNERNKAYPLRAAKALGIDLE